ncbi:hypothetical protein U6A24_02095 [Aquimarina gracilis]|uniref:Uncharacterized protein n=1 Tax=Aquimarina gracilis TaxID=874422 RepID=A0ABU5ZQ97_9FLAO|nr:hypothetical protein [Aquimarina gracilis]MEB3344229.1 hypothetical protein [Aquimarina gracilis]
MEEFKNFKIEKLGLTQIYGGLQYIDTQTGNFCDCLEDTNDNGKADPGECMERIACE